MPNGVEAAAIRPAELALQAHSLATRVDARVDAIEKGQQRQDEEHRALRREMTEMYVALREKIDKVATGVYALLWCAAGTIIVLLLSAVAYLIWETIKAHT